MTMRWPGRIAFVSLRLLVCRNAEAGTPYLRAMLSTVSPAPTVTGEPPSQVQCPADSARCVVTGYAPSPCAPLETLEAATVCCRLGVGSGCATTRPFGVGCVTAEPVTSCGGTARL